MGEGGRPALTGQRKPARGQERRHAHTPRENAPWAACLNPAVGFADGLPGLLPFVMLPCTAGHRDPLRLSSDVAAERKPHETFPSRVE